MSDLLVVTVNETTWHIHEPLLGGTSIFQKSKNGREKEISAKNYQFLGCHHGNLKKLGLIGSGEYFTQGLEFDNNAKLMNIDHRYVKGGFLVFFKKHKGVFHVSGPIKEVINE